MKLSEAIRIGARRRPKCINSMFEEVNGEIHACALGAAFEATFPTYSKHLMRQNRVDTSLFEEIYPELNKEVLTPITGEKQWLQNVIAELNDGGWKRSRIADYVESLGF